MFCIVQSFFYCRNIEVLWSPLEFLSIFSLKVVLKDRFPDHLYHLFMMHIFIFFRQLIQDFHELFIVHSETIALAVHAVYDLEWCDCINQSHHTFTGTHPAEFAAFFPVIQGYSLFINRNLPPAALLHDYHYKLRYILYY